jgi:hypothetical protein
MEPICSLSYLQELATDPYAEPDEYTLHSCPVSLDSVSVLSRLRPCIAFYNMPCS